RRKVQLEVKGDKVENRVLALASHRAYLLTARVPSKVSKSNLHSFPPERRKSSCFHLIQFLVLEYERGPWSLRLASVEEVDEVIAHIGCCLNRICPAGSPVKVMKKLSLKPPERTASLQAIWDELSSADQGPCGGFSHQYWCVCDYLGLPYREEVQWDVDTIYLTQDTRELNLQDFIHLENRDLVAIIAALEYNQWFTKLCTKDFKLATDVCDQILRVVARSSRLEELVLDNTGLRSDFAQKLASALSHNPACTLHTLSLSNNSLEDKGVAALSAQLAKLPMGLKHLNLSRTSMSPKGVNSLCQALCANPAVATALTHLDLSGNSLRGDDMPNLHSFLSHPNCLETLDLSNGDCSLEQVCASLLRGSLKHLSVLNLSKSVFSHRSDIRHHVLPSNCRQLLNTSNHITDILQTTLSLLLGLGCNPNLSDVSLDLSCCELRSGGSQILEGCVAEIPNISSLDISDNGLDMDLTTLLVWLAKNRSIRHLALGKNFNNIKSKNVSQVLDNLVHMIQEEESPLTSLSLADAKLKTDLSIVLNALGSNTSLTKLDISGNAMGDMGAKMLAKALQINTKLRTIVWDRNNISPQGLQDVAAALEKNYTIRFMPIPIMDAAQALKASPEKTEDALLKMEQYLLRNHETRKYLQEQAYRLQQGIVTTTTQQMMDRMCVKVQDHLNSLRFTETNSIQEDMKVAGNLMKDARNSKRVRRHDSVGGSSGAYIEAIQDKLESMAGEVSQVMDGQLQTMLVSMVEAAESLCPHVMKRSSLRQELLKAGAGRMTVPRSFVTNTLLEQAGVDIVNKISELKLSMASFLSDRIVDEILESLSGSQHTLVGVLSACLSVCLSYFLSVFRSIHPSMLPPPVSRMEFDLDKALEEVPIHVEDPPPPPQPLDRMSLPPVEHKMLEHHTKLRPKPMKRTKPTLHEAEQNSIMGKLDEGLDDFFSKKVIKLSFKLPTVRGPTSSPPEATDKKRESRKSGFFNLIKSRTSRSEKSHGAPSITPPHHGSSNTASSSQSFTPVTEETSPTLPTPPAKNSGTVSEPHQELHRKEEKKNVENNENLGKKENLEKKENPHIPRHIGVPMMGMDLLAEMKARQGRMAGKKVGGAQTGSTFIIVFNTIINPISKSDVHPVVPADADESRPELIPRSKPPGVNPKPPPQPTKPPLVRRTSGPLSPASPTSPRPSSTYIFGRP
uniref:Capping protein regulator and myosin 1 linker 1 n=1 Tax=Sander lucioperca TaxID=283035 RepID=A0A8D0CWF4_SANLU